MLENCLSFQSAQKILEYVAQHDGAMTWYNVVKYIDQLGVERIPPPYQVLQALVKDNYLTRDTQENKNTSKYSITALGQRYLAHLKMAKAA